MTWDPEEDGITHINVYSKGRTLMGRGLSNFAPLGFNHPEDGRFKSVEGYWYWLSTRDDRLRSLHGYEAKKFGRAIRGDDWPKDPLFQRKIKQAICLKLYQNGGFVDDFRVTTLPFVHYYVLDDGVIIEPKKGLWILSFLEEVRDYLKRNPDK